MKFTPTSFFTAIANGGSKILIRKVYVRKVTDLTLALSDNSVPWIDVTNKVMTFPSFQSKVEIDIGIPTSQSVQFEFFGIAWWKANIFNATASQYIEIKVEAQIGLTPSKLATDIVYQFSGYLDKDYKPVNSTDTLTVQARSLDDLLSLFIGENLTTQILDGNGYLLLPTLTGIVVSDANVPSYVLKEGVHIISYELTTADPAVPSAKLDDGDWVPLASGAITLANKSLDLLTGVYITDQKVVIQCDMTVLLAGQSAADDIIVTTKGDTLPKVWYKYVWIYRLLQKIYEKAGLISYSFDNFRIVTFDGRRTPSFWDVPPGENYYGKPGAIAYDATNNLVWIGINDRIYTHNPVTHLYSLIGNVPSEYKVVRLWGDDSASGFIWGVIKNSSGAHLILKITISSSTIETSYITRVTATIGGEVNFAIDLSVRGIFYLSQMAGGRVNMFMMDTNEEIYNNFGGLYDLPAFADGNGNYYYQYPSSPGIAKAYYLEGTVVPSVAIAVIPYVIQEAVYSRTLNLWVGSLYNTSSLQWEIVKWNITSTPPSIVSSEFSQAIGFVADETNGWIYWCCSTSVANIQTIKRMNGSGYTVSIDPLPADLKVDKSTSANQICYDSTGDRLIGFLSPPGILFEYGMTASMYIDKTLDLEGGNLRDALNEILSSFLLVSLVLDTKKAIVKRRMDDTGAPVTSGHSIALTNNNTEEVEEENLYSRAVTWISVSNGMVTHSYDGTTWDGGYIGIGQKMEITKNYIPNNLVKDVAYYLFRFFQINHILYPISLANILPLHIECLDEAALTINSKIVKTATGIIYGIEQAEDGQMTLQVLV